MKTVLIANKDLEEAKVLLDIASREFNALVISSPSELTADLQPLNLVLIDSNFTSVCGIDFISEVQKQTYVPILVVTPPGDAKCAAEAIKAGAYNYIVKTREYPEILNFMISEAIQRFDQYEQMKQTIQDLKHRVSELEGQVSGHEGTSTPKPVKSSDGIFAEILLRFRKGEINLPSPPQIVAKFNSLLEEGSGIPEISGLLRQDVSISSKLIGISNSAYYQGVKENKTLEQAICRLGLVTTKKYVEILCNRSLYTTQNKGNIDQIEKLWKHSICCAIGSQITCEIVQCKGPEELFTMGLTHDIGKLILLQILSELNVDTSDGNITAENRAELAQMFAVNHANFGALLLKRWNFPISFQQVALYHDHLENADPISKELQIVHFANAVANSLGYCFGKKEESRIEDLLSTRLLQIQPERIASVRDRVREHMDVIKSFF
jgi:HD-like signal output (HDOD) protein/ActR/RegA family two-component response regulator